MRTTLLLISAILLADGICARGGQPASGPLTPAQERASFHFADPNLTAELVAAEPDVVSPVAIAWDADGRLFVAEMSDYPIGPAGGRVKLLEDRDGDGRYERVSVFADKLKFPNGVMPWKGGVLVTAAPDILFLKDNDGDGVADERRVLFTGFAEGNHQLRVNGLHWGLDNWIYGANGRSDGEVRRPDDPTSKPVSLRAHDFRFDPRTFKFEAIAGRSQFGAARDDWGNRFLSWNTIPIRHEVIAERYLARNPHLPSPESLHDLRPSGDDSRVFPRAPQPLTFNNESVLHFNALAGLTIYRGGALGEEYRGNAFMGESLLCLVHRRVLEPSGPTFVARRGEQELEFLAASDPWFHPVNFATGPDGALYVVDFYRRWVEHPDYVHDAKAKQTMPWREGAEHGRIWRIQNSKFQIQNSRRRLSRASVAKLVKCLEHDNGWWQDTAQRLLVERRERATVPLLEKLAAKSSAPVARVHALWTLEGIGVLRPQILQRALQDAHPRLRENAVRLSESFLPAPSSQQAALTKGLLAVTGDADSRVRLQLALTLGEWRGETRYPGLAKLAARDATTRWQAQAILSSASERPWLLLQNMDAAWLRAPTEERAGFLEQVAALIGASRADGDVAECLRWLRNSEAFAPSRLPILAGLADGLARANTSLRELIRQPTPALRNEVSWLAEAIREAATTARADRAPLRDRLVALRLLRHGELAVAGPALLELVQPTQPPELQTTAARAVAALSDEDLLAALYAGWNRYAKATRREILSASLRSPPPQTALADALEKGLVAASEVDATARQNLIKTQDGDLRARWERLFPTRVAADREAVIQQFQPALQLAGDRRRGAALCAKLCLTCHAVQGQGNQVSPDLTSVASRAKESLLVDLLDPSRQISTDYLSYTLTTTAGESVSGLIASESAAAVTLRAAGTLDTTVPRAQIAELRADGKSLMPDGLEQGLTVQDVADLLEFVKQPEKGLLPVGE